MRTRKMSFPVKKNEVEKVSVIRTDEIEMAVSIAKVKTTSEHGIHRTKEIGIVIQADQEETIITLPKEQAMLLIEVLTDLVTEL